MHLIIGVTTKGAKEHVCNTGITILIKYQWIYTTMRHCATNRKVTGSIPSGVTGFFHWHNPSGRTMALGSTQPRTEMSTRNVSWG